MPNSEITLNDNIATVLREFNSDWRGSDLVVSENTGAFKSKGLRPDILIYGSSASPISVETEFDPAATVEKDALSRLGKIPTRAGSPIQAAFAIKIPARFKGVNASAILDELRAAEDFQYCALFRTSSTSVTRWPDAGYIVGSLRDLFVALQGAAVPQAEIERGADALEEGASGIAAIIGSLETTHTGSVTKIGEALKQEGNLQTFRMAATILINAFVFQDTLAGRAGGLEEIRNVDEIYDVSGNIIRASVISEWVKILEINYWPIFGIAKKILEVIPSDIASEILQRMHSSASILLSLKLGKSSDLSGVIFQRLISDRRFLATFYTTPASAALLVGLAVDTDVAPNGASWSDESVTNLRVADFACGTGSLLCAAYNVIRREIEILGADAQKLHAKFIEEGLLGCDVMPSATHITASILSSAYPSEQYEHTQILTLAFGRQPDGSVSLGAIELLSKQGALSIIGTGAVGVGASGDTEADPWVVLGGADVADGSFDLVTMNPPFTRLTGGGGKTGDVPLPMFAAFGTEEDEQRLMSKRAKKLTAGTCAHGNAGEASIFLQLGHNKLRQGGTIALVLPITFLSGAAWEAGRELIRKNYESIVVVTIAGTGEGGTAFSADTGVAECLLIAKKVGKKSTRFHSVTLSEKPRIPFEGTELARLVRQKIRAGGIAKIEDGPIGGTPIFLGDVLIGEIVSSPIGERQSWSVFRIVDHSLAQAAYQLTTEGKLWLPGMATSQIKDVSICKLGELGEVGPYHLDVTGGAISGGAPRGPFELKDVPPGKAVTFPALKRHSAENERTLEIPYDSHGVPRIGKSYEEKAILEVRREKIWQTRSRLHFNTDFRFNSQSLAFAMTENPTIGGRAWPTFKSVEERHESIISLWGNSTLGLLTYWWLANKAQSGRGSITTSQIEKFSVLDPRALSANQLKKTAKFYRNMKEDKMKAAFEADEDAVRKKIDRFVLENLLSVGLEIEQIMDVMDGLRSKLVLEPSFSGGKE